MAAKIYESVVGLSIDMQLVDGDGESVPISVIADHKFYVLRPGSSSEEIWETVLVSPNIVRHVVPEDAGLTPGRYKMQAYIETADGYKGRCKTVDMTITAKMK